MQLSDFTAGMRIETDPASDRWMMGDRFGTVQPVKGRKYVTVKMDRSQKVVKLLPDHLTILPSDDEVREVLSNPHTFTPTTVTTGVTSVTKLRSTRYTGTRSTQTPEQPNARTKRRVKRSHGVQDISRLMLRS
jgi:hypothetical protein